MEPMIESLLVGLLLVSATSASASAKHLPKLMQMSELDCGLLDDEPQSKQQVIEFSNNSSLTFDGFLRIKEPDQADKYVVLEAGKCSFARYRGDNLVELNISFDCGYVTITPINSDQLDFAYSAMYDNYVTGCTNIEPIPLGPDGSYTSPGGAPTNFKCLKYWASEMSIRYIKLVDRG